MSLRFPRSLLQALAFSLLIHALLLVGVVNHLPEPGEIPVATIRVSMSKAGQEMPAKATRSAAAVQPMATPSHLAPSIASSHPATPAPLPVAVSNNDSLDAKKSGGSESRGATDSSASGPVAQSAAESTSTSREGVSPDDMRQYRMALATAMRRFKRYPPVARDRGWEGTAQVGLAFNSRSVVPEVLLAQSSGRGLLDEQALEMVRQAVRVTHLPEGMKGRNFRVVLPVQFSLENE